MTTKSLFSKQHYKAIADRLLFLKNLRTMRSPITGKPTKHSHYYIPPEVYRRLVIRLAATFLADSPAFKPDLFYKVCGLESTHNEHTLSD